MTTVVEPGTRRPAAPAPSVGSPLLRVEDGPLLVGEGRFVDDLDRPGQLYARIVRSQVAHGRVRSIETEEARRRGDVVAVVTAADLPEGLRIPIRLRPTPAAEGALQPPLAREVVRYVGEPLAVVLATSAYAAEDAAEQVWAEIEELPAVVDAAAGAAEGAPVLHAGLDGNVVDTIRVTGGAGVEALLAEADVVVAARLRVHRHTALPLEPRGLIAEVGGDGRLTVWGPTKVKHHNRRTLAELLGLPLERVRLVEPDVGGGFGPRGEFYPEDFLIPWLALATGRRVKWVEDRYEHFLATNHSREQECEIEVAATAAGELLALRAKAWVDLGAYVRTNALVLPLNTVTHLAGPYRWRGIAAEAVAVLTSKTPCGTYRGPAQVEPALHRERVLDLVARRVGIDPAELRRRNLVRREELPHTIELDGLPDPVVYDSGDPPLLWRSLCEHAGYELLRERVAEERRAGRLVGVGTAAFVEAEGRGPYEWARVLPDGDGGFVAHVGIAALGQGIRTALAQIAADALQVPVDRVSVRHDDTEELEDGAGSFSSRSVVFGGNAVAGAARDLLERARVAGAEALGLAPDEVETAGGEVFEQARPERSVAVAALDCEGRFRYERHGRGFGMGGALAVVELDPGTGEASVRRCVVAGDVGRAINPLLVEGQLVGAAAQGLGGVLYEQLAYGPDGQPLVTSFMDYAMPTAAELPRIETVVLELARDGGESPLGARGAGEAGIVGVGAAVANAVADAVGGAATLVAQLPITPELVQRLLHDAKGGTTE